MIFSELVQAPGFLEVGERPITSVADTTVTLLDTTLAVSPSALFTPSLTSGNGAIKRDFHDMGSLTSPGAQTHPSLGGNPVFAGGSI
jgi:hypothetical protein